MFTGDRCSTLGVSGPICISVAAIGASPPLLLNMRVVAVESEVSTYYTDDAPLEYEEGGFEIIVAQSQAEASEILSKECDKDRTNR